MATIFAGDKGIILEIEQNTGSYTNCPYYFNCSLLSCYWNEDERIFIGGAGYSWGGYGEGDVGGFFQLRSTRLIKEKANYINV